MSIEKRQVRLVCQQCGGTVDTTAVIEIKPDGTEDHHMELPNGWMPIWVPDDKKAKMTCGGCIDD
jgi:hypothetical protein